jgi:hypothetical protein
MVEIHRGFPRPFPEITAMRLFFFSPSDAFRLPYSSSHFLFIACSLFKPTLKNVCNRKTWLNRLRTFIYLVLISPALWEGFRQFIRLLFEYILAQRALYFLLHIFAKLVIPLLDIIKSEISPGW